MNAKKQNASRRSVLFFLRFYTVAILCGALLSVATKDKSGECTGHRGKALGRAITISSKLSQQSAENTGCEVSMLWNGRRLVLYQFNRFDV